MRKKVLLCVGGCFTTLIIVLFCIYLFGGVTITEIEPVNAAACVPSIRKRGNCYQNDDGAIYILSPIGFLSKNGEILSTRVTSMLPVGEGVAFTKDKDLYYDSGTDVLQIAEDVEAYGQYQDTLIFGKDGKIYRAEHNTLSLIVELESNKKYCEIYWMAGNDSHLAIGCSDGLYIYQNGLLSRNEDYVTSSDGEFFLYEQYLVLFGQGEPGAVVCDFSTDTTKFLDLGWGVYNDESVDIAVTSDGNNIYLSLKAVYLPDYDDTLREGTFCIDPTVWEAEKINDKFYSAFLCGENGLFELDTFTLRGTKIS